MHEGLVNCLGGLSLPRKSVVTGRLTDHPDMTLDVYRGRKTTIQYNTKMHQHYLGLAVFIVQFRKSYMLSSALLLMSVPQNRDSKQWQLNIG